MQIFPAIDIINGEAVRLFQGDYNKKTVYGKNLLEVVNEFKIKGATNLHVVDLDGAKDGTLANFSFIEKLVKESGLFIEVGGGIRDEERIAKYLEIGVKRVILGTIAITNWDFLVEMVQKYGEKIAVGVDVKDGKIAINGWLNTTDIDGVEFCEKLTKIGVKTVIFTDVSKDGMLSGTNIEIYKKLSKIKNLDIVASGGVSTLDEINILKDFVSAAIVGKALYTGDILLDKAIQIAERGKDDN